MKHVLLSFLISACGWLPKDHSAQNTINPLDALRLKRGNVLKHSLENLDATTGWPKDTTCDGTTLTAIYQLAAGTSNFLKAQDANVPGKYYRDALHECGPANGSSATTMSQDAFITSALLFWKQKDATRIEDILSYLGTNSNYAGEPHDGTSLVTTPVLNTYAIMFALLKGQTPPKPVDDPTPIASGEQLTLLTGFRAHLLVWHILDRGVIYGAINDLEYKLLKDQAERQPRNVFFTSVYNRFTRGDQSSGISYLLDESSFPSDQLASNKNRCVPYLWSTDDTPDDWSPCPNATAQTYTSIDFLIASAIILGEI